ncbi:hypothetical protein DFJ58DRAFT_719679 [Suillus subalutaceus]|uniref:uncharacterized protein n=1 Tax=Suillus subalutaceus TaxID=48586 RepID=UPI001B872382|nr:uncharacterized protein DFJ58DRAFT_719679 [Suillus subalutaceus]KAG1829553.1 hypothetical protein DFJ58DRAFT_719679 [Suillus subalutaceus]
MPEIMCPSCDKKLASITDYSQHLVKTTNPGCCALYLSSRRFASDPPDEGDFFGTYTEDELAWPGSDVEGDVGRAHMDEDDSDHDISDHDEWEPPVVPVPACNEHNDASHPPTADQGQDAWHTAQQRLHEHEQPVKTIKQPSNATYHAQLNGVSADNIYAPFALKLDWDMAQWAKLRGSSSTAFDELVSIEGLSEKIGLSFKNTRELNKIIDNELPGISTQPSVPHDQIVVANEVFDVYYCDIIECIKALFSDLNFADFLVFVPECHYADKDEMIHLYHEMHTGKWWWNSQKHLDRECPGATIIPIIISSDKTQTAYPIYMTIGNIPKDIRQKPSCQAHVLLAYLPTTRLEHVTNKAAHRQMLTNLYHACVGHVLAPLAAAGIDGINMQCGDGTMHQGHPLFACFAGDYPEQVLATGVKTTQCPKCNVPSDELGLAAGVANWQPRDLGVVLDALCALDKGGLAFVCACKDAGIKLIVHPFWEGLPFVNIFESVTPDVLHQLYQGLIKHLLAWLSDASNMSSGRLLHAVRGLLDFLYLAQYLSHSSETLNKFAQMTTWLEWREKILRHEKYIQWRLIGNDTCPHHQPHPPEMTFCHTQTMMKHPTIKAVTLDKVVNKYGTTHFNASLAHYVAKVTLPANTTVMARQLEDQASDIHIPFRTLPVFHKVKWLSADVRGHGDPLVTVDSVHARPGHSGTFVSDSVAPRFDTVFVNYGTGGSLGVKGYRIVQVCVIFSIPPKAIPKLFLSTF